MNRTATIAATCLLLLWTSGASARDSRGDVPKPADGPPVAELLPFGPNVRPVDPNGVAGLSARRRSADLMRARGRFDEAIEVYEDVLAKQQKLLGDKHAETIRTANQLGDAYAESAWRASSLPEADRETLSKALDSARKAVERKPSSWSLSVLSWTQYHTEDYGGSRKSLEKTVDAFSPVYYYPLTRFLYAAVDAQEGNKQLAQDWFAAGCEMQGSVPKRGSKEHVVAMHVAKLLDLPYQWPPEDWNPLQGIEAYGRLIEAYPKYAFLYHRRARFSGQLGRYPQAVADSKQATELRPENWNYWYWRAMMTLRDGGKESYLDIGRQIVDRFREGRTDTRADLVRYCSLVQGSAAYHEKLFEIAESAYREARYLDSALGIGIAAYRCGRYEDALKWLPDERPDDRKGALSMIFRAMAYHQNGDHDKGRELLRKAQVSMGFWAPKSVETEITWYPAERCEIQIALEEAESLIGTAPCKSK